MEKCLVQDGWSDIHNTSVIHTGEKYYFVKSIDTGSNTEQQRIVPLWQLKYRQKQLKSLGAKLSQL